MARSYSIAEHIGADIPARYTVDGRRRSAAFVRDLKDRADRLDCFATKGKQLPGGRIRHTNYCTATFD